MTIIRNLCGTLKSRKKELAMEQLPTTGSPSPSFNFLTIKLRSYSNSQVADQNCHLDARGSGRRGDHFGGRDSGFRQEQGELFFYIMNISNMYLFGCEVALLQVKVPLVAMKGGVDLQKYVDVLLPSAPATIKIVQVLQKFSPQYFIFMRLYMSSRHATH